MSLVTNLMIEACKGLKLGYRFASDNEALLIIDIKDNPHMVLNAAIGLNSDAQLKLAADKFYSYQLLNQSVLMPKTLAFVDPMAFPPFNQYVTLRSFRAILNQIEKTFEYPLIVKRNSGSQGHNVFLCRNSGETLKAIRKIYTKKQLEYDHVLLGQQYIQAEREFRVISLYGKVRLIYLKDKSAANFVGNLSPLHWDKAVARRINDQSLRVKIQKLTDKLYRQFPIAYCGLDIIEDKLGKLWLIELNATPQFREFVRSNKSIWVVNIFKQALMTIERGR